MAGNLLRICCKRRFEPSAFSAVEYEPGEKWAYMEVRLVVPASRDEARRPCEHAAIQNGLAQNFRLPLAIGERTHTKYDLLTGTCAREFAGRPIALFQIGLRERKS